MNNKEYIAELAQQTGYSQDDTQKMVRKVIDAMIAEFEDGEAVSIPSLFRLSSYSAFALWPVSRKN